MSRSYWDQFEMAAHIRDLLTEASAHLDIDYRGYPFLTAYQLAIALDRREPRVCRETGWPVGGRGSGRTTLADYIAEMLTKYVRNGWIDDIECGRLAWQDVAELYFNRGRGGTRAERLMEPSKRDDRVLHVFRLRMAG